MFTNRLSGKSIAVLTTDGFDDSEFLQISRPLMQHGASVLIIAPKDGVVYPNNHSQTGNGYRVHQHINLAQSNEYHALVIPGNASNIQSIRFNKRVITFTADFIRKHQPIAATCYAPAVLAATGLLQKRTITSHPSLRKTLTVAGAKWFDCGITVNKGIVCCQNGQYLKEFIARMIDEFTHSGDDHTQDAACGF